MEPEMHCSHKVAETSFFYQKEKPWIHPSPTNSMAQVQDAAVDFKYMHFVPERLKCVPDLQDLLS